MKMNLHKRLKSAYQDYRKLHGFIDSDHDWSGVNSVQIFKMNPEIFRPEPRKIEVKYATLGDLNHYAIKIPVRRIRSASIEVKKLPDDLYVTNHFIAN